jgi:hypothetical protein
MVTVAAGSRPGIRACPDGDGGVAGGGDAGEGECVGDGFSVGAVADLDSTSLYGGEMVFASLTTVTVTPMTIAITATAAIRAAGTGWRRYSASHSRSSLTC